GGAHADLVLGEHRRVAGGAHPHVPGVAGLGADLAPVLGRAPGPGGGLQLPRLAERLHPGPEEAGPLPASGELQDHYHPGHDRGVPPDAQWGEGHESGGPAVPRRVLAEPGGDPAGQVPGTHPRGFRPARAGGEPGPDLLAARDRVRADRSPGGDAGGPRLPGDPPPDRPVHAQRTSSPSRWGHAAHLPLPLPGRRPGGRSLSSVADLLRSPRHAAQGAVMNVGPIVRAMRHNRTRVVLIVLEIGMTLAIVTNCINVILAERSVMMQPSGFDADNIVWMLERPFTAEFKDPKFLGTTLGKDLRAIRQVPGVRSVANTTFRLWEGGGQSTHVRVLDQKGESTNTQIYYGTKDLTEVLGVRFTEG